MDGKHFSLITIAMIILLGIVGLGFMQMNTNNTLNMISDRLVAVEKKVDQEPVKTTAVVTAEKNVGRTADFTFVYPDGFTVASVDDGFIQGQKNLRITSKPGTLFLSGGGPAKPSNSEFTDGIQFDIRQAAAEQLHFSGEEKFVKTKNPLVQELEGDCDGVGCPAHIFYIGTKKNTYIMDVIASNGYQYMDRDIETIISSIKE